MGQLTDAGIDVDVQFGHLTGIDVDRFRQIGGRIDARAADVNDIVAGEQEDFICSVGLKRRPLHFGLPIFFIDDDGSTGINPPPMYSAPTNTV